MTQSPQPDEWKHQTRALRSLARVLVGHHTDAEDLVQDALLAGWQRSQQPASMGWLRTVVRSRAVDRQRRLGVREAPITFDHASADPSSASPDVVVEHLEASQGLLRAVQALAPPYREAIYLRYFEDLPPTEIASRLGIPVKTIKSQLSRGLKRLAVQLEDEWGDAPDLRYGLVLFAAGSPWVGPTAPLPLAVPITAFFTMKYALTALAVLLALLAGYAFLTADTAHVPSRPLTITADAVEASPDSAATSPLAQADQALPVRRQNVRTSEEDPRGERLSAPERRGELALDSRPATGAFVVQVRWHDGTEAHGVTLIADRTDTSGAASPALYRAVTDSSGVARLSYLEPGSYRIQPDRGGRRSAHALEEAVAGEDREFTIQLDPGVEVIGTVRRSDGTPLRDAGIWLTSTSPQWAGGRVVARTDSAGGFRLRDVPETRSIGAIADGFAPSDLVDLDLAQLIDGTAQIELQLTRPGGGVQGVVRDHLGQPVAGAVIATTRGTAPYKRRKNMTGQESWTPRTAVTGTNGSYSIQGLALGRHEIYVRSTGFPVVSGQVTIEAGEPVERNITMPREAILQGVVLNGDGTPVPNATVAVEADEPTQLEDGPGGSPFAYPSTTTGRNGEFELRQLAPAAVSLRAAQPGTPAAATARLTLRSGETSTWNPVLDQGGVIAGTLLYSDRSPVKGVYVQAVGADGAEDASVRSSDGTFRLEGLREAVYDLTLAPFEAMANGRTARLVGVAPSPETIEWVLDVKPPAVTKHFVVRMRFDDEAKRGPNGSMLSFMLQSEPSGSSWIGRRDGGDHAWRVNMQRAGTFTPLVHYGSRVIARGTPVELDGSGDVDLGTLRSVPGATLELEIARPPGLVASPANLELSVGASIPLETIELGIATTHRVDGIEPGPVTFRLCGTDFVSIERTLELGEGSTVNFQLELVPAVPVVCHVLRRDEDRDKTFTLSLFSSSTGAPLWTEDRQDAYGSASPYACTILAPVGTSTVVVELPSGRRANKNVLVASVGDAVEPIVIDLR